MASKNAGYSSGKDYIDYLKKDKQDITNKIADQEQRKVSDMIYTIVLKSKKGVIILSFMD